MYSDLSWCLPPKKLTLADEEVHVWCASLNLEASRVNGLEQSLSVDERARAERFYFQKDNEHFIVARGLLRTILGRYLNMEPSQVRFSYGFYGKPFLAGEGGDAFRFNLSHSYGFALYAISRGGELGIDFEYVRPESVDERLAERFSPREIAALRQLPANARQEAFFACWTRKEAYLKARGEGLTLPLDKFDVSLVPGEPAALLYANGDPQEATRWSLQDLRPMPGYMGALAVKGYHRLTKCWQWSEQ